MSTLLRRWRDWLPLLIILLVGAALRFYRIGELPPGLYRDEAFYGLDALGVLRSHPAIFFVANNGREGLFMYFLALGIAALGRTPMALRIVSACIGTLTLIAIYAAGRNLFSHRVGVLSAGVMAVTFWHVALSRLAFRAITLPLLLCITVALLANVFHRLRAGRDDSFSFTALSVMAGVAFGLTLYTYTSAQVTPFLLIGMLILSVILHALHVHGFSFPKGPATRKALGFMALGALITLAPFGIWLIRHPDLYFMRAEQVSILSPIINKGDVIGTLLGNILKAAGMFLWQGDRIWRHNLSLRPVFDPLVGGAFIIGILACLWRTFRRPANPNVMSSAPESLFMLLWLVLFLVPTVLAEDTPHFLRAIGVLPAACIIAGIGLEAGLAWLSRRGFLNLYGGRLRRIISPPALLAAGILVMAGFTTRSDYLDNYVKQDMTAYWLEDSNVHLAQTINDYTQANPPASLWLQDRLANDNPALRLLSPNVEQNSITTVSTDQPVPAPVPSQVLLLVDPTHDWTVLRNALPKGSELRLTPGPMAQGDLESKPRRAFVALAAQPAQPAADAASFERGIMAQRVTLQLPTGATLTSDHLPLIVDESTLGDILNQTAVYTVSVLWSTSKPITEDLAVFVHWQRKGEVITQHDGSPADGYLPMPTWRVGDQIADPHLLTVSGGVQAGDSVTLGLYQRASNTRLQLLDAHGNRLADAAQIIVVR
jgi:4-amino-4-deoxy-L-arabinose transferase-like glycosyltransferase